LNIHRNFAEILVLAFGETGTNAVVFHLLAKTTAKPLTGPSKKPKGPRKKPKGLPKKPKGLRKKPKAHRKTQKPTEKS